MPTKQDDRPLLTRLEKRIEKREGGMPRPTDVDIALHQQSAAVIAELAAALKLTRENLRACQATIHLCGGFDPAYVNNAQAAMKVADEALSKISA
ncbi:hypothetical protein [Pseudomonas syringae group sp. J309-1]|uniref:hypothetical protein n=1 Tax=Pseudomonas syringae group sp. J309-1 TaxID=3079588 RepID=UPI002910796F|nr:hypothetical protein [Pseudomonas syringae group sp. J309-1]MDU8358029.1 hypothetical protein [Pseudomonas syringae group sp. J309-1]